VLGIEFMAAAQALDFRDFAFGRGVSVAREVVRRHVEHLDEDRPLYPDHDRMKELVCSCEILDAVEATVGPLD
jgi:histidine ammonia-lyase